MTTRSGMLTLPRTDRLGRSLVWLSSAALAAQLLLVVGLLLLLCREGLGCFWPDQIVELRLADGSRVVGTIEQREPIVDHARGKVVTGERVQVRVGNRDFFGLDFRWIDAASITATHAHEELVLLERREYGNFYGRVLALRRGDEVVAEGEAAAWQALRAELPRAQARQRDLEALERGPLGDLNRELERLRLAARAAELETTDPARLAERQRVLAQERAAVERRHSVLGDQLRTLREDQASVQVLIEAADTQRKLLPIGQIVHAWRPNTFSFLDQAGLYCARLWEFVSAEPRESNTEGGIFPAIFGTVLMVFLMTFVVTPFGVLAALYLREYARQGLVVRIVRIAVNNLAGVPSIVFGVFGLGFFVYGIGGTIDRWFFPAALPTATFGTGGILWAALTLALLTVPVVIVATEEGLAAVPRIAREGSLALGATKFETVWRVVIPAAAPGILTGVILAIARAAGEVAPLMIVGMVKHAPIPLDGRPPFLHLEGKFMHLGFHIYDVGFQSPNIEATKPLVYATALLLVLIVTVMNLGAISIRNHLRHKYATSAV